MIETFDKTDHAREYELKQNENLQSFLFSLKYKINGELNLEPLEVIKAEAIKEGKRLGKEELLKDLAGTVAEVEIKMTDFEVVELDGTNTKYLDYEKGFKLLKTILTGE